MGKVSHEILLDSLFDGVYFVDPDKKITFWNKAAERITGYSKEEVIGSRCSDNLLRHVDENGHELCLTGCPLAATIKDGCIREAHVYLHHKQGHRVPVSVRSSPVRDEDGAVIGGVEIFSDNSNLLQILREMERLKKDAYVDELTNVGNRRFCEMTLQTRLFELKSFGVPLGLIFLDLDNFKQYNDIHGHATGDEILIMTGRTITNILRRMDSIARWGGEEFVVILPHIDVEVLQEVSERMRSFIESTYLVSGDKRFNITASIGATMALLEDTPSSIIQRADRLMYESKASGKNRVTMG
jgi:diguanylate cyclase (GGDEF)-like protein/PAS domain S-box-containing protein